MGAGCEVLGVGYRALLGRGLSLACRPVHCMICMTLYLMAVQADADGDMGSQSQRSLVRWAKALCIRADLADNPQV